MNLELFYTETEIEDAAIALYYQAVFEGRETATPDTVDKDHYRKVAYKMMANTRPYLKKHGNDMRHFFLAGSTPPPPVVPEHTPSNYADIPSIDPYI